MTLEVRTRSVGPWPMNTYVLVCPATKQSMLIDPGADVGTLQEMLADTTPIAILLTHTHPDHVGALAEMRATLGVPLLAHPGPHHQGMDLGSYQHLAAGERIPLGQHRLIAEYAPGHIDDMICFREESGPTIIVGDTVFAGGPGRTWSVAAFATTLNTLHSVVLAWPDDAICYPGHGPSFRLGDLRGKIKAFANRAHPAGFFGDAEW
jgi:hydroxyacylglutathione hydrolase